MSAQLAAKCLELSPGPELGYSGLERHRDKFFRFMKRLEDRERCLYNVKHWGGCRKYTEDAEPYFSRQEWAVACADAALRKLSPPERSRRVAYTYR